MKIHTYSTDRRACMHTYIHVYIQTHKHTYIHTNILLICIASITHLTILPRIYICYLIASKPFNLSNPNRTSTLKDSHPFKYTYIYLGVFVFTFLFLFGATSLWYLRNTMRLNVLILENWEISLGNVCMYVCSYMNIFFCTPTMYLCQQDLSICMYACLYVYVYLCTFVYVCMYVCMYVCI